MTRSSLALLSCITALTAQEPPEELLALWRPQGLEAFPPLYKEAVTTFLAAEEAIAAGDLAAADGILAALWKKTSPGTARWMTADQRKGGLHFGRPPAYNGLRMLTDVVKHRLVAQQDKSADKFKAEVRLTVVLIGKSHGVQPRTSAELKEGVGVEVQHAIAPELLADDHRIIHQSLRVFGWYVEAATQGKLSLNVDVVTLDDLDVPVQCTARHAGPAGGALKQVWDALPGRVHAQTDWWWVMHPGHVPEQHEDFKTVEFITGGMGVGPDGGSPMFLCDDRWLVRKPPHLGQGVYSDFERRCYLPQWLQHEFFHHLFRTWPKFELEKTGHQWFDRSTWPEDFEGRIEPDYYHEALHKRLQPLADPPLHIGLSYRLPDIKVLRRLRSKEIVGSYLREPVENDWHAGEIRTDGDSGRFRWTNRAGRSWSLEFDPTTGALRTGSDCPYCPDDEDSGPPFTLELARDPETGEWLSTVAAFRFQGGRYQRAPARKSR